MHTLSSTLLRCFLTRPSPIAFDMSRGLVVGRLAMHLAIARLKASLVVLRGIIK